MAVDCRLEDESGKEIDVVRDPTGVLNRLIPAADDGRFQCWRFIDEYGDTVFNHLQMGQFLNELELLRADASQPGAEEVLGQLERLARRCQLEVHLYLKFYGD